MKFFKGSRNETFSVKIRSVYFILGLLIGMAVSMSSKLYAYDENGEAVYLAKTFTLKQVINLLQVRLQLHR